MTALKFRLRKKECRFCALLESSIWGDKKYFRCTKGRFDDAWGTQWFTWRGIRKPNKKVALAQENCPYFKSIPE
ncbi:MAG: hypothetical protein FJ004_08585 [Chloroflexi bacterium]|nr:hypothetical protein [Chloroflexota bacterium]